MIKRTNSTCGRTELWILLPGKMFPLFVVELTTYCASFLFGVAPNIIRSACRQSTESSNSTKRKNTSDGLKFKISNHDLMGRKKVDNNYCGRKDGKPTRKPTGHLKGKIYADPWLVGEERRERGRGASRCKKTTKRAFQNKMPGLHFGGNVSISNFALVNSACVARQNIHCSLMARIVLQLTFLPTCPPPLPLCRVFRPWYFQQSSNLGCSRSE